MNCEQFEDNIGAFALGALPDGDMREAREHLDGCERHPEARELMLVASSLVTAAPPMDPPPTLRARLMDAVQADADTDPQTMRATKWNRNEDSPGILARVTSWLAGPRRGYALSGALAVVVAALAIWNVSLQSEDTVSGETVVTLSGAATGRVVYIEDEHLAVMDVEGVSQPPSGHVYQVWAISGGQPASLGILEVGDDGTVTTAMTDISLEGVDTIAVTVEPTPGSDQPTTDPVITGEV